MTTIPDGRYVSGKVTYSRHPLNLTSLSNRLAAIHSIGHGSLNGKIMQIAHLKKNMFDKNLFVQIGKTAVVKVLKLDVDSTQDPTS